MSNDILQYSDDELRSLHQTLYEILAAVDEVCQKHGIEYFIIGGTAIGAHFWEGIIPWDDDVDVGMTRENYERFLAVAQAEWQGRYFLQTPYTEPHSPFFFSKVRKEGTMFAEEQFSSIAMHQGIYIDIFPFDDLSPCHSLQRMQHSALFFLNGLLISKEIWQYRHCGHCDVKRPRERGFLACLLTRVLVEVLPKRFLLWSMHRVMTVFNRRGYSRCKNIITPNEWLEKSEAENPQRVKFGPLVVAAPKNLDEYLSHHYGKVVKDCPAELRVNHRPSVLRF